MPRKRMFEYKHDHKEHAVSVIGAGDCFAAFLAMGYVHGFAVAECAEIAFKAGTAYVKYKYNHPISCYELLRSEDPIKAKYLQPSKGSKLVFTNGCFDLLHPGHIELLRFAKSKGERLVVALNSDESIRRLKGSSRPIMPLVDRMQMIANMDCVDHVTSFDEDTPYECIKKIQPNVLIKGADYEINQIIGADLVEEVYRCPIIPGASTTNLISRI
jgi:rfaE bifunctional protein nucleotidyltransferase chain/domain